MKIANFILCIPLLLISIFKSIYHGKYTSVFFTPGKTNSEKTVEFVSDYLKNIKLTF